jgi:hypothetical protein
MAVVTRRTPEDIAVAREAQGAGPKPPRQDYAWPPSQYHEPERPRRTPDFSKQHHPQVAQKPSSEARKGGTKMPTLTARSIKITIVLDAVETLGVLQQATAIADARVPFTIDVEGRRLHCTFAAKSVRKALATLQHNGPENVAVLVQGRLLRNDEIGEAGLVAQLRAPKPEPVVTAAETAACSPVERCQQ